MKIKILIVEDQFIEANNLKLILKSADYEVCSIARSVEVALGIIGNENPDMVLIDIFLQGEQTGIDLARILEKRNTAFVFVSANSNRQILDAAKATRPYGFLVKPFRKNDVLVMLDVAWYLHQHKQETAVQKNIPAEKIIPARTPELSKKIIGGSESIMKILHDISIVARSNTSVLILGESGTGKELVAQAIHQASSRSDKPFVTVNCGALPPNLVESELFGHEKGAFTGALNKRVGKFEQANEGTIFLDEVGELPLDLQVKFLRVLQEREIESIGGQPKKIDVRIIAATNRDLEQEVAAGRFRIDLYYRLNIFPLLLPPLRERQEDILPLANHFLQLNAQQLGKSITGFTKQASEALRHYSWPGNIRELQNMVERSVLLADGALVDTLHFPKTAAAKETLTSSFSSSKIKTMTETERDHIISVLEKCHWKVSGKGGAAELLDINVNTLNSRMKKLGIEKEVGARKG